LTTLQKFSTGLFWALVHILRDIHKIRWSLDGSGIGEIISSDATRNRKGLPARGEIGRTFSANNSPKGPFLPGPAKVIPGKIPIGLPGTVANKKFVGES
jgi:hypothetical protein